MRSTLLLLLAFSPAAAAQTPGEHNTGDVQSAAWDDGSWGRDAGFGGTGFVFMGEQGLFAGNLLIAVSPNQISGQAYANPQEFTTVSEIVPIPLPPFPVFDQGYESQYNDFDLSDAIGVSVVQRTYSSSMSPLTPFVGYEYELTNNSGRDLAGIYVGNFSDWDIGSTNDNQACYDSGGQVLYVWSDSGGGYFGVSVVGGIVSGWDDLADPDDASIWTAMTNGGGTCTSTGGDRRVVIAQGPFEILDGESVTARFCMIGGEDAASVIANAFSCESIFILLPAIEPKPDGTPGTHSLSTVYPNPFNPQASFTLEVAEQQSVRIAVYDALGREVATLFNGTLTPGTEHAFTIDGAGLPSGTYIVRAIGEHFIDVRRVALVK